MTKAMFDAPEKLLRSTKGTLKERPLPLLFQALFAQKRTAGLELKRQALEKVIVFEAGAPVGCSSNLVHESIGRYLVEKKALAEDQYLKVLAQSARREVRFEKVLLEDGLVDPAALQRHLQALLAQKILDAFRWTDTRYRLVADVEIDPEAPRMNAPQLLFTALCSVVPIEVVSSQLGFGLEQRFALVHEPPVKLDDLKLSPKDARLVEALKDRPSLLSLQSAADLDAEAVRRRVLALSLLGLVDLAEKVPLVPPPIALVTPVAPDPMAQEIAEAARRRRRIVGLAGLGLALVGAAAFAVDRLQAPSQALDDESKVIFEPTPRSKPTGAPVARIEAAAQPTAPAGAVPQTGKPRALTLSASGIPLEPPEPLMGKGHWLSLEASRLLTAGKPAEAREVFVKLAKDDPKDARLPYGIALTFFLEGKDADAREQDAEALELAPEFADAHLLAAFLDQLSGNEAEAKTHYEAFLTTESSSPRAEDVRLLVERLTPR